MLYSVLSTLLKKKITPRSFYLLVFQASASLHEKPLYTCEVCLRTYNNHSGYRDHQYRHKGRYRHHCSYCGKGFLNRMHFDGHVNQHEGRRPYCCEYCGQSFPYKSSARMHWKLCNPGVKPDWENKPVLQLMDTWLLYRSRYTWRARTIAEATDQRSELPKVTMISKIKTIS